MSEYVYITDGSLEGLLCAIHEMYYSTDDVCDILHRPPVQQDFAVQYKNIKTDALKANKVFSAIVTKISHRAAEEMTYTWLSELPFCGRNIARYIKLGFKIGYKVDYMVSDENVLPVHKAASKVRMEVHRLTGLCRFSKTPQGFYVCNISPDHNVLTLLAPHFASRMRDMYWVICDTARSTCAVYDRQSWYVTQAPLPDGSGFETDESEYQSIWKTYFDTVAIEGRINPKLQRKFVPVRYRKNMTEFCVQKTKRAEHPENNSITA